MRIGFPNLPGSGKIPVPWSLSLKISGVLEPKTKYEAIPFRYEYLCLFVPSKIWDRRISFFAYLKGVILSPPL